MNAYVTLGSSYHCNEVFNYLQNRFTYNNFLISNHCYIDRLLKWLLPIFWTVFFSNKLWVCDSISLRSLAWQSALLIWVSWFIYQTLEDSFCYPGNHHEQIILDLILFKFLLICGYKLRSSMKNFAENNPFCLCMTWTLALWIPELSMTLLSNDSIGLAVVLVSRWAGSPSPL